MNTYDHSIIFNGNWLGFCWGFFWPYVYSPPILSLPSLHSEITWSMSDEFFSILVNRIFLQREQDRVLPEFPWGGYPPSLTTEWATNVWVLNHAPIPFKCLIEKPTPWIVFSLPFLKCIYWGFGKGRKRGTGV